MCGCITSSTKKPTIQFRTNAKTLQAKPKEIESDSAKKDEQVEVNQLQYLQNPYILNSERKQHVKLWHESYSEMKDKMQRASLMLQDDLDKGTKQQKEVIEIVKQPEEAVARPKLNKLKNLFEEARNRQKDLSAQRKQFSGSKQSGLQTNQKKRRRLFNNKYVIKQILQNYNEQIGTCSICTETYNESDRLPMMVCMNQHTFCERCVNDIWSKGYRKCPLDQNTYTLSSIQKNRLILEIIRQLKIKSTKQPLK